MPSPGVVREEGLFIQTGNPFTVSETTPFALGFLGKVSSFSNSSGQNGASGAQPIDIQYVKRYATDTTSIVQGDAAFWQDTDNFVVTAEAANAVGAATAPLLAGVFGGTSLAAGAYGFIQVGGVGVVRLADSTSSSTVGIPLVWSTGNEVLQATTAMSNKQVLGVSRTLTTVTGTHVSAEALINVARLAW